jgi:hypothetical protein
MQIKHNLTADQYATTSRIIQQRIKIKIIDKLESAGLNFSIIGEERYNLPKSKLVEEFSLLGEVVSADGIPCLLADKYILIPSIVDSGTVDGDRGFMFEAWTRTDDAIAVKSIIDSIFNKYRTYGASVKISWALRGTSGDINFYDVHNVLEEQLFDEAYPYLDYGVDDYISKYLKSESPVLIFMGKPGTGKTRFIRYILQTISAKKGRNAEAIYTMDQEAFGADRFFLHFLTNGFDAMVLEDIDINLKPRSDGNSTMNKLLGGADGLIRNKNRKIILSTNLTNIKDIDDALMQKGRCFDRLESRLLSPEESGRLLHKINPSASYGFPRPMSVSEIYHFAAEFPTKPKENPNAPR